MTSRTNVQGYIYEYILVNYHNSKAQVCDQSRAGIAGSNLVRGMDVSCEYCESSGRGCDGPIPRPEEPYRVCVCVCVCY